VRDLLATRQSVNDKVHWSQNQTEFNKYTQEVPLMDKLIDGLKQECYMKREVSESQIIKEEEPSILEENKLKELDSFLGKNTLDQGQLIE